MDVSSQRLGEIWHFPWPVIDVLIGGKSAVDLPSLKVQSWKEATEFIASYGYDPNSEDDQLALHSVTIEALNFIEKHLIPTEWNQGLIPPQDILLCEDPRYLLLWASNPDPDERLKSAWACAVLRVMHTIIHSQNIPRPIDIEIVKTQILGRFQKHIFHNDKSELCFGTRDNFVILERIDWKCEKKKESIILKLLQKTGNVAETIYDLLGVRIVTKRFCDTMMAVKFLRDFCIVNFPNCIPSRARNNLVDVNRFRNQIDALRCMMSAKTISPKDFEQMISKLESPAQTSPSFNPHSASTYRAIQLTCRQQVTFPNPVYKWLENR